jgi:uncharacterized paraquat-inducible protein A
MQKQTLNKRFEEIGWALFLLLAGALLLFPANVLPAETWVIGAGAILLAVNAARYATHIPVSVATTVLGFLAIGVGIASMFSINVPVLAVLLLVCGAAIIVRPFMRPKHG